MISTPMHAPPVVVLIVEDEPLILLDARDTTEDAGYDVVVAADPAQALSLLECTEDVAIVFTDVHLPGSMDGVQLAHAIRQRWPSVALVLTSGESMLTAAEIPAGSVFLAKPYKASELRQALESAAGARPAAAI